MPSVKLSVTIRSQLESKYPPAVMTKLDTAVKKWCSADAKRGIKTIHVALDDKSAMAALGAKPVTKPFTAAKLKTAIDDLWKKLAPDYLVLFGGQDIVPYFVVPNPSYDPNGDDDKTVLTDNPYACSKPFRKGQLNSFLVSDRVVGRIPDMPGDSDPEWLLCYLDTATRWNSQPRAVYEDSYAICCDAWKGAGLQCVQYLGEPASRLMISPPNIDTSKLPRSRLGSRLHLIKCHGSPIDPTFYGQKGDNYPESLSSVTLRKGLKPNTIAAAMCCYGAQTFSPADPASHNPGQWPIAAAYLRGGAFGFAGSTRIAWVGGDAMMCADWIASSYLRSILEGASQGRALLGVKQDYIRRIQQNGEVLGREDEKTLIEYLLLGDPSIQPVVMTEPAALARGTLSPRTVAAAVQAAARQRQQRRIYRASLGVQIREALPKRTSHVPHKKHSVALFNAASAALKAQGGPIKLRSQDVQVDRIQAKVVGPRLAIMGLSRGLTSKQRPSGLPPIADKHESYQYYWSARREVNGQKQLTMVRVETDSSGQPLRTKIVHSS